MNQPRTAEDKILCVLESIKAQYDISPKSEYSTSYGMGYGYRHPAGEVKLNVQKELGQCGLDFNEYEKILARLKEDGLLEDFKILPDFV